MSKKNKFNQQQELFISKTLDMWCDDWNRRITRDPRQPHNLPTAKEELKKLLLTSMFENNSPDESEQPSADK